MDDELVALAAIYAGDDELRVELLPLDEPDMAARIVYRLRSASAPAMATLRVLVPRAYPPTLPLFELEGGDDNAMAKWDDEVIADELRPIAEAGQGVLFQLIEAVRTRWEDTVVAAAAANTQADTRHQAKPDYNKSGKGDHRHNRMLLEQRAAAAAAAATTTPMISIASGEPIEDRKSIFQAHVASVTSAADVELMLQQLKSDRKIARATHNIMAYRFRDKHTGALHQDNDDDGENAAGSRLGHLLDIVDAMDVCVVVSRWYGGIQLGPDRFKRINEVARRQLELSGVIGGPDKRGLAAAGPSSKRGNTRK